MICCAWPLWVTTCVGCSSGDDTTAVAAWLAAATLDWRASANVVARRIADNGTAPDARVRALARDIPLNWVPDGWLSAAEAAHLMRDRLATVTAWAEARRSDSTVRKDQQLLGDLHTNLEAQLEALSRF